MLNGEIKMPADRTRLSVPWAADADAYADAAAAVDVILPMTAESLDQKVYSVMSCEGGLRGGKNGRTAQDGTALRPGTVDCEPCVPHL